MQDSANSRLNLLADARFTALHAALVDRMAQVSRAITPENFASVCSPLIRKLVEDAFKLAGATEGSIWLADADRQNLVIAYNTGANAAQITGFKQSLNRGLISAVYATEQPIVENQIQKSARHDKTLGEKTRQVTHSMIAVPLHFLNEMRGIISCVKLTAPDESPPPGFDRTHLQIITTTAAVLRELIDGDLLELTVGWR